MSSTKDFNRYWSPEVTKLVQELKEARERLGTVVNDFQFRVSFGCLSRGLSLVVSDALMSALAGTIGLILEVRTDSLSTLLIAGLRRIRQGLLSLARRHQNLCRTRLSPLPL